MVHSTIGEVLEINHNCTKITTVGLSDPGQNTRTLGWLFNGHCRLDEQAEEKKFLGLSIFHFTFHFLYLF